MADIINLKNFRKQKVRVEMEDAASLNREKFGRTKSAKQRIVTEKTLSEKNLDGHKRNQQIDKFPKS